MFDFLIKNHKDNVSLLYDITDGTIIIGGSTALKLYGIINRDVVDIDLNIQCSDWEIYKNIIYKNFKVYPMQTVFNDKLGGNILCYLLTSKTNRTHFDLFVNYTPNMFDTINYKNSNVRLFKPELIMYAKQQMIESEPQLIKHGDDILKIKNFLNEAQ